MNLDYKLRDLYKENLECAQDFNENSYGKNLKEELILIRDNFSGNLKSNNLDDYSWRNNLSRVLRFLPAKVVLKNFGEGVLKWSVLNEIDDDQTKKRIKEITKLFPEEAGSVEQIRLFLRQRFLNTNSQKVLNLHGLTTKLDTFVKNYDLKYNLEKNLRKRTKISDSKLEKYSLSVFKLKENSYWRERNWDEKEISKDNAYFVKLESPASIGLMKNQEPCAMVSFIPTSSKTLLINSLQGINKRLLSGKKVIHTFAQTGLGPFYWKKFMFEMVRSLGRENKFDRIGIQSGHNNLWTKPYYDDGKIHLSLEKAFEIYDKFAKEIGMVQIKDKNWYIKI